MREMSPCGPDPTALMGLCIERTVFMPCVFRFPSYVVVKVSVDTKWENATG